MPLVPQGSLLELLGGAGWANSSSRCQGRGCSDPPAGLTGRQRREWAGAGETVKGILEHAL